MIVKLYEHTEGASYRDYKTASSMLVKRLNLGNIQTSSYNNFLKNIIKRHMKTYTFKEEGFEVSFDKWWIDTVDTLPEDFCKSKRKSLEVSLKALVTIHFLDKFTVKSESLPENTITLSVEVTRFPALTSNGNFIINGVDKILISHLERADKLIVTPPDPKKADQFGQLELRSRYGSVLTMDKKVKFKDVRRVADNTSFTFDYVKVLQELGYIEDSIFNVMGSNTHFKEEDSENLDLADSNRSANIYKILNNFTIDIYERQCINQKTHFTKNLSGKVLAKDLVLSDKTLHAGSVVSVKDAEQAQEEGILSVMIVDRGVTCPILNNGFVDAEKLFSAYGLETPDDFKMTATNPLDQSQAIEYYVKCNKNYFEELYKTYGYDKDQLLHQIDLNINKLLGTCLVKNDITAMMNLFSRCTSGMVEFDDIDNLENKKVVNISDIFEEKLIEAIGGGYSCDSSSLIGKIKRLKKMLSISTVSESGASLLMKMDLDLDCKDKTITKATSTISLFNNEDSTNPLAQINHKRKITSTYVENRGGIKVFSPNVESRSVNPSYAGRIDCIETPESQAIGLVREIGALAYLNEFGQLEAPFFRVDHEKQEIDTSKVYYLSYSDEVTYKRVLSPKIAEKTGVKIYYYKGSSVQLIDFYNLASIKDLHIDVYKKIAKCNMKEKGFTRFKIEVHKKNWFVEKLLTIQVGHGKTITGEAKDVDFVSCSGEHIFSPVTSAIPFIEYDDATRGMMGSVMSKQAIPVWGIQKQVIRTPMAEMIPPTATGVIVAPYDLEVVSVDALGIKVRDFVSGKEDYFPCLRQDRTTKTTLNQSIPTVKVGDVCLKGDIMADNASTKDGELAHGTQLLTCILPLGFNYEDGVIINARLVKEDIYTSIHIDEYEIKVNKKRLANKTDVISHGREFADLNSNRYTNDCIVKIGTEIQPNDILAVRMMERRVRKGRAKSEVEIRPEPERYKGINPGTVVSVEHYTFENGDDIVYTIKVATKLKVSVGDKYTGRHGNKGITCLILPEEDMPYLADGRRMDIAVNPLGIPSRMNIGQLDDGQGGLLLMELGLRAVVSVLSNFDGEAFKRALVLGNCDKRQLYDGRTGKPFRYKTTVAYPYTEKLEHVVDHKIHARANAPYTRRCQPTQGKASNGGQRIGEMEFWALAAHGAVATQRELTAYKSDDVENRTAFNDAVSCGDVDWVELENRKQNVSYAFMMTDIYYKSAYRYMAYFDKDGNEIDISVSANKFNRSMSTTLKKIEVQSKSLDVNQGSIEERSVVFADDDDDDLGLDDFDFPDIDLFDSPTEQVNLPQPKISLRDIETGYYADYVANTYEDNDDDEDVNEDFFIDDDFDENDFTGDEMFSEDSDAESEVDPF